MRASFRQPGELTVKFLELLVLDPSSKPSSLQLFGEAGADASLLRLKMIRSRHLSGNSFSSKLSAKVIVQGQDFATVLIVQGQDFATVLHVITPDQRG
jgi:hypothetical protein